MFNQEIANDIVERNIAYRLWIANRSTFNHNQFKRLRKRTTTLINNAKANYVSDNLSASSTSKDLWKRIKNLNISKTSERNDKFDNSIDEINDYFSLNFTFDEDLPSVPPENGYGFRFYKISENDIIISINSTKSNAVGLDEIFLSFIKLLFPSICLIIHFQLNCIFVKISSSMETFKNNSYREEGKNVKLRKSPSNQHFMWFIKSL